MRHRCGKIRSVEREDVCARPLTEGDVLGVCGAVMRKAANDTALPIFASNSEWYEVICVRKRWAFAFANEIALLDLVSES